MINEYVKYDIIGIRASAYGLNSTFKKHNILCLCISTLQLDMHFICMHGRMDMYKHMHI